jgi:hypothetical protein
MTCEHFVALIDDYLDGALPAAEFEAHLAECPWCVDFLHSYVQTLRLAKATRGDGPPGSDEALEGLVRIILAARPDTA